MVNERLHIICGNCGSNDSFEFNIDPKGHDITVEVAAFEPAVFICCKNCSTIHDLSKNALMEKPYNKEVAGDTKPCKYCSIYQMPIYANYIYCPYCTRALSD